MKRISRGRCKRFLKLTLLTCIIGMISGCDDKSTNHRTDHISADMEVISNAANDTVVKVYLRADGENLDLVGSDRLEAEADGQLKRLIEEGNHYQTTFPNLHGGTEINISFIRDGWGSATDSAVPLPARFEITQPDRGEIVSEDRPIIFSWSPPGDRDDMWLQATYECQQTSPGGGRDTIEGTGPQFIIDDFEGSAALTLTELLDVSRPEETFDLGCDWISVQIVRERFGRIDPAYESGDISARQERNIHIHYQP